jgi:hypothetical protein|tara:strand:- start:184 stop:444 length:261 start_codon:yes stop_codon:yes gene_type:complete
MTNSRYRPKKMKAPIKAIREHCIECMGGRDNTGYKELIENCVSPMCALYDFRFGTNPHRSKIKLSDEERRRRSDCAQSKFFTVNIT